MQDNRNQENEQRQGSTQANENSGATGQAGGQQKPADRMKDGTNDFENGDQEENSEGSTSTGGSSQNV